MFVRALLTTLTVIALSGCASPQSEPLPLFRLAPGSLGSTVSTVQHLEITFSGIAAAISQPPALDTLLDISPTRLRLAALAWGNRVLTLDWDGVELKAQHHIPLPSQLDEKRILRDIQLAYWPLPALQAALPSGWSLQEDAGQRLLHWQGQRMVTIRYQASPPWLGHTELSNHKEGYRLTLHTLPQEGTTP